jgi:hypothetical protein
MVWRRDSQRHAMSARGIKNKPQRVYKHSDAPKQYPSPEANWSHNDVRLLQKRINENKQIPADIEEQMYDENGIHLDSANNEQGRKWLMKQKSKMSSRELSIMQDFDEIKLVGFYAGIDITNGENRDTEYKYPMYRVVAKPDSEGHRDAFEYGDVGGKLYITG